MRDTVRERKRRVLVVQGNSLMSSGVLRLLSNEAGLRVVGTMPADEGALIAKVARFRPDVVLLEAASPLTNPARLLSLLQHYPVLRVVVMSPDRDVAEMYDRTEIVMAEVANLLAVLR
jgi:DNA-binding NarL/FixJ family response regulator